MPGTQTTLGRVAWICASTLAVLLLWFVLNSAAGPGIAFIEEGDAGPGVSFFYSVPVGLTTWWFGRRWGVGAAAACGGIYLLSTIADPVTNIGFAFALRALVFAIVIVVVSIFRERLVVLEHSAEELEAIRAALTPPAITNLPDVDAGAAFAPSEYGVSGDFYLLTNGPDNSTIAIVGDVAGHGPKAARLATFVRARLAAFAANTSDPAEILTLANSALIEQHGPHEEMVSAVCLRYRPEDSTVCWALAGHPWPLRLPHLQEMQPAGDTLLLGVREHLELTATEVQLDPADDGVLIYTDGATDVRREDALLGLDGLVRLLSPLSDLPAPALAREAQRAVLEWTDKPIGDDLCLLVLRPKAENG
jgi:serine phosphatase RsbU (regulator of sigma subunit)